ncbi:hypothetical protein [Nocardioides daphniae]|uniref:Uncharacterized protein n=1 Tax=Nocardioides daphniae TaxID=402297 RepID=A0A4P7UFI9_9ACTN|nr:hypothetical protein [Nocardioides daphniae]QCC78251.1 hypothetical protein E2C04_15565 [Nocardioides daphniae]
MSRQPRRGPRGGAVQPPRQVAPDDDPDFLWDLERKRRREAKEHGQAPPGRDGTPETSQDGTDQDGTAQGEGTGEESTGTS